MFLQYCFVVKNPFVLMISMVKLIDVKLKEIQYKPKKFCLYGSRRRPALSARGRPCLQVPLDGTLLNPQYDTIYVVWHQLTHWGRATHICVGKLTTIGSDNSLSPGRRQAIIWTIAGILLIGPLKTNFSEILIGIQTFSFKKMHLKMSCAKWRPFVSASMC